ncbi:MAG: PH domain-containing protein [Clostridium sp.]|nr:PH domain-containing protein [Clostridium sp.]MCM1399404.1 PH domain-containing protein [Clostridium sp.]MCM1459958.1 PH domain-containing protein [Bacteroides sp.]
MVDVVWNDRKRIIFGLPWTFTKYGLSEDRIFIETGLFNLNENEVRLYRIMDVSLERKFWQRLFGLGTITCHSSDKTMGIFKIENIKKPSEVKELISSYVEEERSRKRVTSKEFIVDDSGSADDAADDIDEL